MSDWRLINADVLAGLASLPDNSVHCCVTSPPYYGLRSYGTERWEGGSADCDHLMQSIGMSDRNTLGPEGYLPPSNAANVGRRLPFKDTCGKCGAHRIDQQIGLEPTPAEFVATMVRVFAEVKRVLRPDGTLWLNLGDSYAGSWGNYGARDGKQRQRTEERYERPGYDNHKSRPPTSYTGPGGLKPKDLMMMPARVALALQDDGWWLRSDIIWCKRAPMPESVTDRPTSAHEHIFLLTKSAGYYYDADALRSLSPSAAGGADLATFSRPTLRPELRATIYTDNNTTDAGGRVDFREPQVPVILSVARQAKGFEIVQLVGIDIALETSEGHYVIDLQRLSAPAFDAPMPISVKSRLSLFGPVWATIPDTTASPSGAILASHIGAYPVSRTLLAAKVTTLECALIPGELFAANITIQHDGGEFTLFVWSTLWSAHIASFIPEGNRSIAQKNIVGNMSERGVTRTTEGLYLKSAAEKQNPAGRNLWNYWLLSPEPYAEAHFATFPTEIPRRAILAGTSERGCCAECGTPWERVVSQDEYVKAGHGGQNGKTLARELPGRALATGGTSAFVTNLKRASTTTGWAPTCRCNCPDTVPATVLDPFSGAGTTLLVASRLGRRSIGIELSPEYCRMAQKRIESDPASMNMRMELIEATA